MKKKDDSSPIDCTTKDIDRFCWGLVNQFLDLLEFQRLDMPTNPESTPNAIENEIDEHIEMQQCPNTFQSGNMHQKDLLSINEGTQIAIPQECKICLCCIYWRGNAEDAYKNIENEYGECNAFAKRVLAADGVGCDKFKGNYGKITKYEFYKKLPFYLKRK